ncbi:MAG: protease pro-enzyme activation domain-containing protein [Capsulimonadaceae bacterium]
MNETHVVLPDSFRAVNGVRLGDVDSTDEIEATLVLAHPAIPADLPSEPVSFDTFSRDYSTTPASIRTVESFLAARGFNVVETSAETWRMRISGKAQQYQEVFQASLGLYRSPEGRLFRGRSSTLSIPKDLDGIVTAVLGLDERRVALRHRASLASSPAPAEPLAVAAALTPEKIEDRYRFPAGDGASQRIAIAEFGGGLFLDDLQVYCDHCGRPVPTVEPYTLPGALPLITKNDFKTMSGQDASEQMAVCGEVMMDVEIIAGLCPKAAIDVYFARFDERGWIEMLAAVVKTRPVALSISWGFPEDSPDWSKSGLACINDLLRAVAALGVTVCVAAGDDGSGDGVGDNRCHVQFPSSSPFVLSVGGTMVAGNDEVVWREGPGYRANNPPESGATGGGVSALSIHPRPSWQNVEIPSANSGVSFDGRVIPDVAAIAGPPRYYTTLFSSEISDGANPNNGTSAGAPLWAALIARIDAALPPERRGRFLTPLLYRATPAGPRVGTLGCRDITVGDNTSTPHPGFGYSATAGFDAVTGWGVPDGQSLLDALNRV